MSLNEVLATLSENDVQIEITEKIIEGNVTEEVSIIEFEASGYEALSTVLLEREVEKIIINKPDPFVTVKIELKNITTP